MRKLSGKFHFFLRFCTRKRSETYNGLKRSENLTMNEKPRKKGQRRKTLLGRRTCIVFVLCFDSFSFNCNFDFFSFLDVRRYLQCKNKFLKLAFWHKIAIEWYELVIYNLVKCKNKFQFPKRDSINRNHESKESHFKTSKCIKPICIKFQFLVAKGGLSFGYV